MSWPYHWSRTIRTIRAIRNPQLTFFPPWLAGHHPRHRSAEIPVELAPVRRTPYRDGTVDRKVVTMFVRGNRISRGR